VYAGREPFGFAQGRLWGTPPKQSSNRTPSNVSDRRTCSALPRVTAYTVQRLDGGDPRRDP